MKVDLHPGQYFLIGMTSEFNMDGTGSRSLESMPLLLKIR